MTVVPLGPGAGRAVLKALADNEVVCLLCDRNIGAGGVEVEFFGERTLLPAGPAMMAIRAGAPLVPVGVYFTAAPTAITPSLVRRCRRSARVLRDDVVRVTQDLTYAPSASSAGRRRSGTCSCPTGRAILATKSTPGAFEILRARCGPAG